MLYSSRHPLIGSATFESWQDLCEAAVEAGEKQAEKDLKEIFTKLTFLYSDAIIANSDGEFDGGD